MRIVLRIGDALTFTACSSNWKRKIPFAVSVNLNGIFMREREKERSRIDNLFIFPPKRKSILTYTEIGMLHCRIWPRFLFLLSAEKESKRVFTTDNIVYLCFIERYDIQITEYKSIPERISTKY